MKLSTYILANRSQSVEPPVPVEPVEATVTAGAFYIPYHQTKINDASTVTDATNTYTPTKINRTIQNVPINWTANSDFVSLKPTWSGGGSVADCWILPTKGSFTLAIGNTLAPGRYVFEVVHFVGGSLDYWNADPTKPSSKVVVNPVKTRIVKNGAYGVIDATLNTIQQEYTHENPSAVNYSTRTIETRVRYGFEIAEGDTEKIFAWGSGTDIDLAELWRSVHILSLNSSGSPSHNLGSWVNAKIYFRVTVYTAR